MTRPQQQRGQMPALQRINQSTTEVVNELGWLKQNSPSLKARRQAGKAILSFELGEAYAEKAINFHEQKETQSEEYGKQRQKGRFQETT